MVSRVALVALGALFTLSACAKDISSDVYSAGSTMGLTMYGKVLSVRPVRVKDHTDPNDNKFGGAAGGILGGVTGSTVGDGSGQAVAVVGAAIVGSMIGSYIESKLGEQDGFEYILQVDTSKIKKDADYYDGNASMKAVVASATTEGLITIVQGNDAVFNKGQEVFAIFDGTRARIVPRENF
jgi:outer membrane lipoprotein SlyB